MSPAAKNSVSEVSTEPLRTVQKEAARVTLLGLALDLFLGAMKIIGGMLFASFALVADGIHSLSDAATDLFVLAIARTAYAPADTGHPYGHGRFEALGTGVMGLVLFLTAFLLLEDSWLRLGAAEANQLPALQGAAIAALSIAGKEWIFRYTLAASERLNSSLLKANAWHSRSDALSSIAVLIGVLGASLGWLWMDLAAAAVVALMIARLGWDLSRDSVNELVDRALPSQRHAEIIALLNDCPGVLGVNVLRSRLSGGRALIEAHLLVNANISVSEGHHIGERAASTLKGKQRDISEVLIHIDPAEKADQPADTSGQPSREFVEETVAMLWRKLGNHEPPPTVMLHYSAGGLDVELFGTNADGGADLSSLSTALSAEPWLRSVQIFWQQTSAD